MVVPAKLIVYGNSKVFTIGLGFVDVAVKVVLMEFWWFAEDEDSDEDAM